MPVIWTTTDSGIFVGNDVPGIIYGLVGKDDTTIYDVLGNNDGIEFGVTIGVVNNIEIGADGYSKSLTIY